MNFAKFPMLRFAKGYCAPSFHSASTKFYCKYVVHEGIDAVSVFGVKIFVNMGPYGSKKSKISPPPVFIQSELNFMINTAVMEYIKLWIFW